MASTNWFTQITQDLSVIPDFITHYEQELKLTKKDIKISGIVEKNISQLPGQVEHVFNNLQVIEAVLEHLNIQLRKTRSLVFKKFLENYPRQLSSRDCEKYVDGSDDVIDLESLINTVALLRNQYLGVTKAYESKNFMLGHLVRLKTAGMTDFEVG